MKVYIVLLLVVLWFTLSQKHSNMVFDERYGVAVIKGDTEITAMAILRKAKRSLNVLLESLSNVDTISLRDVYKKLEHIKDNGVYLVEHRPVRSSMHVAFVYTQARKIHLCLFDKNGTPVDNEVLFSVLLHEITHFTVDENDKVDNFSLHSNLFKSNEKLLVSLACTLGLLPEGGVVGRKYCDTVIPNPFFSK